MKLSLPIVVALLLPSLASAREPRLRVVPWVYDPAHTHAVISRWVPFSGHGDGDPAIIMSKLLPTAADAAAVATVEGVDGRGLAELGFDVFDGGHCGAGAPRYNVTTSDGHIYFFGCAYGNHTAAPDKPATFTRVRFRDADAVPQLAGDPPWPGFGHVTVSAIELVFDEGLDDGSGFTAVDDLDVGGRIVERGPGDDD